MIQGSCADIQEDKSPNTSSKALALSLATIANIQVTSAFAAYSETWLVNASQCIFMSYFVEIPDLGKAGLQKTYQLLQVVTDIVTQPGNFHIAGPMEFRFVKGGDSVMAGTYNTNPDSIYVNLDLIAFVQSCRKNPKCYSVNLLRFMATVERAWYNAGGLPHQGKIYGFFDPDNKDSDSYSAPFNDNFIQKLNERRDERAPGARQAFEKYRNEVDPQNMFRNEYVGKLLSTSRSLSTSHSC